MYKKIMCTVAMVASLSFSPMVLAHECGEGMHKMIQSLNLDAQQKSKIQPILDQLKTSMKDYGMQMMQIKKQINDQMWSGSPNLSNINSLIDKKASLIGNMMKAKFKAKMDILPLLNDKQKSELQSRMKQKEAKMEERYSKCHDDDNAKSSSSSDHMKMDTHTTTTTNTLDPNSNGNSGDQMMNTNSTTNEVDDVNE